MWDAHTDDVVATFNGRYKRVSLSLQFSLNGTSLVSGSDDTTMRMWDMAKSDVVATLNGYDGKVKSAALLPPRLGVGDITACVEREHR